MNKLMLLGLIFAASSAAHEPEVTRKTVCEIKGTNKYFMEVDGADFGAPEIGKRYVKVWREQAGVDVLTISDPLDHGGLNSGLCTCGVKKELSCD